MKGLEAAQALLRRCRAAQQGGAGFPTVWRETLSTHPLVRGIPVQRLSDGRPTLEVPLITGQRLILDDDGYSLG
ncbi:hypothetical protein [Zavarzinia sp. CC-PAN008]|uniref:hypothetical protein n=1 Tax=Zavarzinia sp. CC-PAN008 TaxID=3243332 RepID=UPI003F744E73